DWYDHDWFLQILKPKTAGLHNCPLNSPIVPTDSEHQGNHRWHEQHYYPSTGHELDDSHDHDGGESCCGAEPIHDQAEARITILTLQPMGDHPALGQSKGEKCSHRKKRNQPVCNAAKYDQQRAGQEGE